MATHAAISSDDTERDLILRLIPPMTKDVMRDTARVGDVQPMEAPET